MGDKSRELKRYEHLSPTLKQQTVVLIAGELDREGVTGSPTWKWVNGRGSELSCR
jgi:hypothetical protein